MSTPQMRKNSSSAKSMMIISNTLVSKVRVIVRVRPFLRLETANGEKTSCVSVLDQEDGEEEEEVAVYLKDKETR